MTVFFERKKHLNLLQEKSEHYSRADIYFLCNTKFISMVQYPKVKKKKCKIMIQ